MIDLDMMHVEETSEVAKKDVLYQEDIQEILAWSGSETEAIHKLNITRDQFRYVRGHYNKEGKLDYRRNLEVISYE